MVNWRDCSISSTASLSLVDRFSTLNLQAAQLLHPLQLGGGSQPRASASQKVGQFSSTPVDDSSFSCLSGKLPASVFLKHGYASTNVAYGRAFRKFTNCTADVLSLRCKPVSSQHLVRCPGEDVARAKHRCHDTKISRLSQEFGMNQTMIHANQDVHRSFWPRQEVGRNVRELRYQG